VVKVSPGEGFVPFERSAIERSIPCRFAGQVAAGPDRLAVKVGSASLTYAELDRRANQVACAILAAATRPGPVALVVDQGLGPGVAVRGAAGVASSVAVSGGVHALAEHRTEVEADARRIADELGKQLGRFFVRHGWISAREAR
jgi:hypothetical protein